MYSAPPCSAEAPLGGERPYDGGEGIPIQRGWRGEKLTRYGGKFFRFPLQERLRLRTR